MFESSSPHLRRLRIVKSLLAIGVVLSTWLEFNATSEPYPSEIHLGAVTVPAAVVMPTALALAIFVELNVRRQREKTTTTSRLFGVLAAITILCVVYAVANLNLTQPGVFFAVLLPIVSGFLLAVAELLSQATVVVCRTNHMPQ